MNKVVLIICGIFLLGNNQQLHEKPYDTYNEKFKIIGNWHSVNDYESFLFITKDSLLFFYDEGSNKLDKDPYFWINKDTFYTIAQEDTFYYSIEYFDDNNLILRYLGFDKNNYFKDIQLLNYEKK